RFSDFFPTSCGSSFSGHGYPTQCAANTCCPRSDRFWLLELRVSRHFSTFYGTSVQSMDTQLGATNTSCPRSDRFSLLPHLDHAPAAFTSLRLEHHVQGILGQMQPNRPALGGRLEFRPRVAIDVELCCRREG